jgi:transposase
MRTPGPLRACGQRVGARRGRQVAVVAVARKLASLAWRLLTSGEDYAYASPSRVRLKLRRIELLAGAPRQRGRQLEATPSSKQEQERELALAAEHAYQRLVADWQTGRSAKQGAGAAVGRTSNGSSQDQAARQTRQPPTPAL